MTRTEFGSTPQQLRVAKSIKLQMNLIELLDAIVAQDLETFPKLSEIIKLKNKKLVRGFFASKTKPLKATQLGIAVIEILND